jgi:penicillin-binding protein 1A
VTLSLVVVAFWLISTMPDADAIRRIGEMDQATAVFDRSDRLAFTIYKEQRIDVPLREMSPHLVKAIVAVEDQRFYDHRGYDPIRIASAVLANLRRAERAQGGSTITQQLARQSFLTPDKTYRRKLQELVLAARIERVYSKARILELYLNKVYFGDGLYGAEAASRGYLGKSASALSVPEAALLAGLVKSPSSYAPTVSLTRAIKRRNIVLRAMYDTRAIDRATWESAKTSLPVLRDNLRADEPFGRYFKEAVRRELVSRFGWQRVYQGGLRVYTTIDMPMQHAAEAAVASGLEALEKRRQALAARRQSQRSALLAGPVKNDEPLQAALLAMEPATGDIRAMVGGRDFSESSFNRAVQAKRQPGSAFKPFVYAAALESGFTPATLIHRLDEPIPTLQGAWTPEDEHSTATAMTLRTGLRTSSNRAAVRLLQQVGIPRAVHYAKTMGVGDVPAVPSLALGSGEVTLEAMTAAYASFANRGLVPQARVIRRVEDRGGRVLYTAEHTPTRAISETTAFLMSTMLSDVINAGTGARARGLGFTLPAAGKTGTTNEYHDAWFVGFTPSLAAGVWVGLDQPKTILPNGFAGDVAVPMWTSFMKVATRGDKPQWLLPPAGITTATVCRLSGQLARRACEQAEIVHDDGRVGRRSMAYTEYFVRGTTPVTECSIHEPRSFLGIIATILRGGERTPAPPASVREAGPPTTTVGPIAAPTPTVTAPTPTLTIPTATVATPAPPRLVPSPAPAMKKRGFWGRLFGLGDQEERASKEK